MRVPHEAGGKQEEVGAGEICGQAALRLPLERPGTDGLGAQHPTDGRAPLFDHLPQRARRPKRYGALKL